MGRRYARTKLLSKGTSTEKRIGGKGRSIKTGLLPGLRYAELYDLARAGLPHDQIAHSLQMSPSTLTRLKERDPAVKSLLEAAKRSPAEDTFQDYLYGHLSHNQRKFWDKLTEFWKADKSKDKFEATERIQTLMSQASRFTRMGLFVHAWIRTGFNTTRACRMTCTALTTLNGWKKDPKFQRLLEEMEFHRKNFFESAYFKLVRQGNPAAVIHAAKSVLADRGYGSTVKFEGNMTHTKEEKVSIEDLGLDLETQKRLLRAYERREKEMQALPAHDDAQEAEVLSVRPAKRRPAKG